MREGASCDDADRQGATAARIGHEIRQLSGLPTIVSCLGEPAPDMHQKALVVLGNLSSDAFDDAALAEQEQLERYQDENTPGQDVEDASEVGDRQDDKVEEESADDAD